MDYLDALSAIVTFQEVVNEIRKHGFGAEEIEDFLNTYGIHLEYEGSEVLEFLGY